MSEKNEPLPCPFCGGTDVREDHNMRNHFEEIFCDECGATVSVEGTHSDAVMGWNRRAAPASASEPVKVKPLEWFVMSFGRRAETLIGPYEITFDEPRFYVTGPSGFSANVGSEGEAKTRAQADFERHIRLTIDT